MVNLFAKLTQKERREDSKSKRANLFTKLTQKEGEDSKSVIQREPR